MSTSAPSRRLALRVLVAAAWTTWADGHAWAAPPGHPDARWHEAAEAMRRLAVSWGDQSYGAVVVMSDGVVGQGPSRVVRDRDPDAHAERVAIADAQRRLGRQDLGGAVLYSTSRPCALCEAAASRANVARMFHGPALQDAGPPLAHQR